MREIPDIPNPFCPFTPESYGISFLGSLNDLWSLRYPGSGIHSPFSSGLILYLLISVTHLCPTLQPHGLQHTRLPCPSPTPGAYSNKYSSHWCCHPTISSSVILPFSPCLQSFLVSGYFPMSQFFESGGQSIGVSDSASVLPMNIQDWFPLGCTGWTSLQSKGLSRVFSNTIVQKHQFFSTQLSLYPTLTFIHDC